MYNKISQKAYCTLDNVHCGYYTGEKRLAIHRLHNLQPFLSLLDWLNTSIPDTQLIVLYMYNKISQKSLLHIRHCALWILYWGKYSVQSFSFSLHHNSARFKTLELHSFSMCPINTEKKTIYYPLIIEYIIIKLYNFLF